MTLRHWTVHTDSEIDTIVHWVLDNQDSAVNIIDLDVISALELLIQQVENNTALQGIIISSGKSSGFIAGADIKLFEKLNTPDQALPLVLKVQAVFNQLAALKIPTVCMIDGFCMGGGTELALACRYRVADDGPQTRIGLPEIKLGIHPGWGGTIRLPLLIGAKNALEMILTGSSRDAKKAQKIGLVTYAVPKRHLLSAAKRCIFDKPAPPPLSGLNLFLNLNFMRSLFGNYLRKQLSQKISRDHYPAPYKVIDLWEKKATFNDEAHSISDLIVSPTAKNLVRVFFLQERLKNLGKNINFNPDRVHVVGAGTMGGDIAAWCALRGAKVTLQDTNPVIIGKALKRAYLLFTEKLKDPRLIQAALDRLMPDSQGIGIAQADIIIEAIYENAEAKQTLFKQLEKTARPDAILATNTSSIPLEIIRTVMQHPKRLIGLHFFNPVSKMLLVEVVHDKITDKKSVEKSMAFVHFIDKLPLPVKSAPGFLVNRILIPYMLEAMQLFQENIPANIIDKAMTDFGMPMGPIELADTVGLDICLSVIKFLSPDQSHIITFLEKYIAENKLGKKSGQGFYQYKNNKKITTISNSKHFRSHSNQPAITARLLSALITESKLCLQEKIAADSDLIDAGMIFGIGFAPFRGGPLHYDNETTHD